MVWLLEGDISLKICLFVLTEFTNVTDGLTDGQTPHDGIGSACIASRGKKRLRLTTLHPGHHMPAGDHHHHTSNRTFFPVEKKLVMVDLVA